ncbi:triphosphoribosyl-dephospho-CoA synthase MdcB (plasmid) [Comamonadaceae bacterium OTU4NAUVB1]|nr:triphosphoribosyl-dephospho-CoA synthase MdcB [Comamonadaceae bacterium OTU4NAUVB1]
MSAPARRRAARPGPTPADLGRAAVLALHDELSLAPKPGLVTPLDRGSHDDMDAHTFMRSLFALRHYFVEIAGAGFDGAAFDTLERLGIAAEARMLAATGGVNTHRGAIFMLGLLCAAAGAVVRAHGTVAQPGLLREALRQHWGAALARRGARAPTLPGGIAARRLGLRGASQEAALGFPVVFDTALPALASGLARGLDARRARLDALFHVMAVLDDSNLAHRGGLAGLREVQALARRFVARGGIARPDGPREAQAIAEHCVARRLSPGGAADTLAAACWLLRVGGGA